MAEPDLLHFLLQAHPWHGIDPGKDAPARVAAYVEIVPSDTVKYELDKASGLLRIDRPQRFSSLCPTLYGFIPQTWCGAKIGERCAERTGKKGIVGDGDPIDICIVNEKPIPKGGFLVDAVPVGGFRMVDGNEADDKIVAVLADDPVYGEISDIGELPVALVDRLRHYFLTYKQIPGETPAKRVEIVEIYDRDEAHETIRRSRADYREKYGDPAEHNARLRSLLKG